MQFNKIKLKDIADINMGQSPSGSSYKNNGRGIPFLQGNKTFGSLYPTIDTWTTEPKKIGKKNSVLMSVRAPVGDLNIANKDICIGRGLCSIEMKNGNNQYLYYLLKNSIKKIKMKSTGTVFDSINRKELENIEILDFDKSQQKKISKVLFDIDKKIELNIQTNDNLYELGDALYKEYYSKYENELPNGYKYLNLNEVSVNFDSKRKPMSSREREQHKGTYPYYGATSIIDYVDDYIFDDTYLLMGEDGTVKTSEGYPVLQYIWGKNWINNHAHVLQGTIISTEHLMFALRKKNIEALITGAVQPKINQVNMNKIKIIIGTDKVNKKFEEKIKIIVAKIKANTIENETLIQLRDTLLPKLMNGEIDLDKIEI